MLTSTNEALSEAALALSTCLFTVSAFEGDFGTSFNAERSDAHVLEASASSGEIITGAASSGLQSTVLTNSRSLKGLLTSVVRIAKERLPVVFHVSTFGVSEDLVIFQDFSDIVALSGSGITILASGNTQESHDLGIVAHIASKYAELPILHFFDGFRGANQHSNVQSLSPNALSDLKSKQVDISDDIKGPKPTMNFSPEVLQTVMNDLSPLFKTQYKLYEYSGNPDARAVIIAMGSIANVVENTLKKTYSNIGVLKVRLVKPWSSKHFLQAIPDSARRVCVLDNGKDQTLMEEVAASFNLKSGDKQPFLSSNGVFPSVNGFTSQAVLSIIYSLVNQASSRMSFASESMSLLTSRFPDSKVDNGDGLVVFASQELHNQVNSISLSIAEKLVGCGRFNVNQCTSIDAFAGKNGVVRSELRVAPSYIPISESCSIQDASVVLLDSSLVDTIGVIAACTLREGGTMLILSKVEAEKLANDQRLASSRTKRMAPFDISSIPEQVCAILSRKRCHLASVDSSVVLARTYLANIDQLQHLKTTSLCLGMTAALFVSNNHAYEAVSSDLDTFFQWNFDTFPDYGRVVFSGLGHLHEGIIVHPLFFDPYTHYLDDNRQLDNTWESKFKSEHDKTNAEIESTTTTSSCSSEDALLLRSNSPAAAVGWRLSLEENQRLEIDEFLPRVTVKDLSGKCKAAIGLNDISVSVTNKIGLAKLFPDQYNVKECLRPVDHGVHLVRLVKNERLTPIDYERNIFHLEFDISDTSMTYKIGDALGVFGHNDEDEVDSFIKEYNLNPETVLAIPARNDVKHQERKELLSVRNMLVQHLDIFGKPPKKFYVELSKHAARSGNRYTSLKLLHTGTDDNEAYKLGVHEGTTFADLLLQYKESARLSIEDIVDMVPRIAPRHYSIASSMNMNPRSVHLLVVAVQWKTPLGRVKFGQCTRYLSSLKPGLSSKKDIFVAVDVMPSVLRLPEDPKKPIVMSGLGTGMAPFRAFVQERKFLKEMGHEVGPMVLYFGARHRHQEWLYGDEWEDYAAEGLVTKLGLAFSRDQKEKIYIQDRIQEDKTLLQDLLGEQQGNFYLCGPTWPVPAIRNAIAEALDPEQAAQGILESVDRMKDEGRYILEVY